MYVAQDRGVWRRGAAAAIVCVLALALPGCAEQGAGDGGSDTRPAAAKATPKNGVRKVEQRIAIPFESRTKKTDDLKKGAEKVAQRGRDGVRLKVWRVTTKNGETVSRKLLRTVVVKKPVPRITLVGTRVESAQPSCHLAYSPCVPVASDVDCAGGSGDGPAYVSGAVRVLGSDPYDLDSDGDGWGCTS